MKTSQHLSCLLTSFNGAIKQEAEAEKHPLTFYSELKG